MHILLFGGSFDPPHIAHHRMIQEILRREIVDEVRYVPAHAHPFHKHMSPDHNRVAMLQLMLAEESEEGKIRIEEFELHSSQPSYSFFTLEALAGQFPQHHFSWLIGADNVKEFGKWKNAPELLKKYTVYVYPRSGYAVDAVHADMVLLEDFPEIEISSTEIRQRICDGQPIHDLVDPQVEQYIRENHLYCEK
jgi:nicotinate-nucleotide adenylyltransferase